MSIRTIILDPDSRARARLCSWFGALDDFEVVEEDGDDGQAATMIARAQPNLVVIKLPLGGIATPALIEALGPPPVAAVVALGTEPAQALQAFEIKALDFLIEPVREVDFHRALTRVRDYLELRTASLVSRRQLNLLEDLESAPHYLRRVAVKVGDRILFVQTGQISWIEATHNYSILHVGAQTFILREKISALEATLDPERFFRVSRSALINVNHVAELRAMFKGEYVVLLKDGSRVPMTRGVEGLQRTLQFC